MTNKYHQRLGWLCLSVVIAETLLVILSWLLSAMRVEGVRSLLSSEGIRWFFSSFNNLIASPVLVGLLLLLCALGCLQKSRVADIFGGEKTINFRDRLALYVALAFLLIYVPCFQPQVICSPQPSVAVWYPSSPSASRSSA